MFLYHLCKHAHTATIRNPVCGWKGFTKSRAPGFEDKCFLHLLFFALTPIWTTCPECGKTSLLKFHPQGNGRWLLKGGLQGLSTVSWGLVETSKQWAITATIHAYTTDGFLEFCRQGVLWTGNPNAWRIIQKKRGSRSWTSRGERQECKSINEQTTLLKPWKAGYKTSIDGSDMIFIHSQKKTDKMWVVCHAPEVLKAMSFLLG